MPGYYGRSRSRSPRDRGLDVDTRLRDISPFGSRGRDRSPIRRGGRDSRSPPPRGRSPPPQRRAFDRWSPSRERRRDFGGGDRDRFNDRRDDRRGGGFNDRRDDWRDKRDAFRGGNNNDRFDRDRREGGFGGGRRDNFRDYGRNDRFNDRRGGGGYNDRRGGNGGNNRYGQTYRSRFSLLISNIDRDVDWRELKDIARKFGEVTYTDCNKLKENEGIVTYANEGDMHNAFREMDNYEIRGRAIRLEYEFPEHDGGRRSGSR